MNSVHDIFNVVSSFSPIQDFTYPMKSWFRWIEIVVKVIGLNNFITLRIDDSVHEFILSFDVLSDLDLTLKLESWKTDLWFYWNWILENERLFWMELIILIISSPIKSWRCWLQSLLILSDQCWILLKLESLHSVLWIFISIDFPSPRENHSS